MKGWPGGPAWLNTSTLLARDNFAAALALGTLWTKPSTEPTAATAAPVSLGQIVAKFLRPPGPVDAPEEPAPPRAFDPARVLEEGGVGRPAPSEDVVRVLLDLYLPGGVRPEVHAKLVNFVTEGQPTGPVLARRVREAAYAVLTSAEYHLA